MCFSGGEEAGGVPTDYIRSVQADASQQASDTLGSISEHECDPRAKLSRLRMLSTRAPSRFELWSAFVHVDARSSNCQPAGLRTVDRMSVEELEQLNSGQITLCTRLPSQMSQKHESCIAKIVESPAVVACARSRGRHYHTSDFSNERASTRL